MRKYLQILLVAIMLFGFGAQTYVYGVDYAAAVTWNWIQSQVHFTKHYNGLTRVEQDI